MKVSVIIVNHNTPGLVATCIGTLNKHLPAHLLEVIVVNNGDDKFFGRNTAGSPRVLNLKKNLGFGASNNKGATMASGDILWFLNSDALVIDGSIFGLFTFVEQDKTVGIVTPLLYRNQSCHKLQDDFYANRQTLGALVIRRAKPRINLENSIFLAVDVVVGASMVMRREVFEELGGFDEKIFMYLEDDDLCFRAQKAGYKVGVFTKARVVHLHGQSIKSNRRRKKLYYESQNYFWRKHYGMLKMWLMRFLRWPLKFVKTI